jgi:hypothetical protein
MSVIGPISKEDWRLMIDLREGLKFYKETDRIKYSKAIEKEEYLLSKYLSKYTKPKVKKKILKKVA